MATNLSFALARHCRKHGIALVYLFGSQAREGARLLAGETVSVHDPLTDLDVGVVTIEPLPDGLVRTKYYAALYNDFVDMFKPLRLDLVLLEENHSVFQLEAVKGICVYAVSEERRDTYEMMILRRAADFRPFLEAYLRDVLEEA
ncbi:MAG: nucleotidyltransferase domain-containing protein [Bacillota bacterium]|nr:nucleotidyltransferase domain-containing protein [Bacillota bacterium]